MAGLSPRQRRQGRRTRRGHGAGSASIQDIGRAGELNIMAIDFRQNLSSPAAAGASRARGAEVLEGMCGELAAWDGKAHAGVCDPVDGEAAGGIDAPVNNASSWGSADDENRTVVWRLTAARTSPAGAAPSSAR